MNQYQQLIIKVHTLYSLVFFLNVFGPGSYPGQHIILYLECKLDITQPNIIFYSLGKNFHVSGLYWSSGLIFTLDCDVNGRNNDYFHRFHILKTQPQSFLWQLKCLNVNLSLKRSHLFTIFSCSNCYIFTVNTNSFYQPITAFMSLTKGRQDKTTNRKQLMSLQ